MPYHYIIPSQLAHFVEAAFLMPPHIRSFCHILAETGCRLGEAAVLRGVDFDRGGGCVYLGGENLKSLKRAVPVTDNLLTQVSAIHGLQNFAQRDKNLWKADHSTYWRWVEDTMRLSGIEGRKASCTGIRYGRILTWIEEGVQVRTIQQWLGLRSSKTIENFLVHVRR